VIYTIQVSSCLFLRILSISRNTRSSWRYIDILWSKTTSLCKKLNIIYNIITCNQQTGKSDSFPNWFFWIVYFFELVQFTSVFTLWRNIYTIILLKYKLIVSLYKTSIYHQEPRVLILCSLICFIIYILTLMNHQVPWFQLKIFFTVLIKKKSSTSWLGWRWVN